MQETFAEWREDRVATLGAALAFYSFFSVGPLLLIAVVVAGWLYPAIASGQDSQVGIRDQLATYVGAETAATLEQLMSAASRSRASALATIVGIIGLLFSATGAVVALKDAMNTIWGVKDPPGASWWWTIRDRLSSLAIVLVVGALLILASILTAVFWGTARLAAGTLPVSLPLAQAINMAVSFVVITLLFAAIFKLLPDVRIGWRDVLLGAAITAILFLIGKELFALYVSYVSVGSAYGTAGSLAILLLFNYYSAQVFFLGAEFTQVYARYHGTRIEPKRGALRTDRRTARSCAAARKIERQDFAQGRVTLSPSRFDEPAGVASAMRDGGATGQDSGRSSGKVFALAAAFVLGWFSGKRK